MVKKGSEDNDLGDFTDFEEREEISALLTAKQREYLRGQSDIEEKSAHQRSVRSRIRDRLVQSISDLQLLNGNIEPRDLEKVFQTHDLFNWISSSIALFFDGIARASDRPATDNVDDEEVIEMFEAFVESSLEKLYANRGIGLDDVDVSIDVDIGARTEELVEKEVADLSLDELLLLLQNEEISRRQFVETIQERDGLEYAGSGSTVITTRQGMDDE